MPQIKQGHSARDQDLVGESGTVRGSSAAAVVTSRRLQRGRGCGAQPLLALSGWFSIQIPSSLSHPNMGFLGISLRILCSFSSSS